jgi:hypothetical protein
MVRDGMQTGYLLLLMPINRDQLIVNLDLPKTIWSGSSAKADLGQFG